jgi:hypothetical protein
MELYLAMDKLAQEKPIRWRVKVINKVLLNEECKNFSRGSNK